MRLTVVFLGVPEGLVELGEVENHQQLVRFRRSHLLSPRHWLDAKLSLSHVKRQLVVPCHVVLVKRIKVTDKNKS